MAHPFLVFTYVSSNLGCPADMRAVAHCFEMVGGKVRMLPATQMGATETVVRERLDAFLEAEIARDRAKLERVHAPRTARA